MKKDCKIRLEWVPEAYKTGVAGEPVKKAYRLLYPIVANASKSTSKVKRVNTVVKKLGKL